MVFSCLFDKPKLSSNFCILYYVFTAIRNSFLIAHERLEMEMGISTTKENASTANEVLTLELISNCTISQSEIQDPD
jgi:hypothetical protein